MSWSARATHSDRTCAGLARLLRPAAFGPAVGRAQVRALPSTDLDPSSRIMARGYDHVMARTSHSALVTRLFTRAGVLLTLPPATSSASSSATSSLDPMGATLKRFPHGATTGPRPQRPGRRYGQLPHRPGPDRPVGRLLLTEDLTRWADATARLFAETDAREDAAHLETVWVLEDA